MDRARALAWGQQRLEVKGIATARLDALVLLEDATQIYRARLLADPDLPLEPKELANFKKQISLRARQLPLAYVRGKSEFYGREFKIDKRVLEPRPESEALIEELKSIATPPHPMTVTDIGTGSGALIITAKLELPFINAIATDISPRALTMARHNADTYKVEVDFLRGDLLKPLPPKVWDRETVVLANLPYVPDSWQLNPPALREPAKAIFGGPDGLSLYRRLFAQLSGLPRPPEWVLTESMPPQHGGLKTIARGGNYRLKTTNDFVLVFKTKR